MSKSAGARYGVLRCVAGLIIFLLSPGVHPVERPFGDGALVAQQARLSREQQLRDMLPYGVEGGAERSDLGLAGGGAVTSLVWPRTLSAAVEWALAQRLDIRLAESGIRQARAAQVQADSHMGPRLDLVAEFLNTRRWDDYTGISASYDVPGIGPAAIAVTGSTPRYQLLPGLDLNYNVYAGGGEQAARRQAVHRTQAATLGLQVAMQQVVLDVVRHHLAQRASCLRLQLSEAALRLAEQTEQHQQRRHRRGELSKLDMQQASLVTLEKREQRDHQRLAVQIAHARDAAALGRGTPASPLSGRSAGRLSGEASSSGSRDALSVCEFSQSLESELAGVRQLQKGGGAPMQMRQAHDISAAREQVRIERAAERPQVSLFARYALAARRSHDFSGLPGGIGRQQVLFGVRLRLSLYDGGLSDAKAAAANEAVDRLVLQHQRDSLRVYENLQENRIRQEQAVQRLEIAKARLVLAGIRKDLACKRFRAGRTSVLARQEAELRWKEANAEVTLAELTNARLLLEVNFAEASYLLPPFNGSMDE